MTLKKIIQYTKFYWNICYYPIKRRFFKPKKLSKLTWAEIESGIKEAHRLWKTEGSNLSDLMDADSAAATYFAEKYGWFFHENGNKLLFVISYLSYWVRTNPDIFSQYE